MEEVDYNFDLGVKEINIYLEERNFYLYYGLIDLRIFNYYNMIISYL